MGTAHDGHMKARSGLLLSNPPEPTWHYETLYYYITLDIDQNVGQYLCLA